MRTVVSKTFDEIRPGDAASIQRTLQAADVRAWTTAFGDAGALAESTDGQGAVGIVTAILTGLAASALPGPGSSVRSASVQVKRALPIDSVLTVQLKVCDKRAPEGLVLLDGLCTDVTGNVVASAMLEVLPPATAVQRAVPEHRLDALLAHCRGLKPMLTGVVHPCSADALAGAVKAAAAGLIEPVLFAPEAELHEVASTAKLDLTGYRIVATDGAEDSALKAAMAAGSGEVRGLMKGSLHTDVLLHAVVQKEATAT
jgi:phosphate acetyltransferase